MESVMRLSVCLYVCLVCSVVARPRRRLLEENQFDERGIRCDAMRCDAMQCSTTATATKCEKERENERASSERGESQRLDSGLNVVSAIRLGGNPKMPFCAS